MSPCDDRPPSEADLSDVGQETAADRLRAAFDMFELGVNMKLASLRRQHPNASPEEIDDLLDAWLLERPGAELGDGPGTPVSLERFR